MFGGKHPFLVMCGSDDVRLLFCPTLESSRSRPMVGHYRYISEEEKKLVLTMSLRGMKAKDIELATGIKCRTLRWLISLWKSTGEVVKHTPKA